MLFLDHDLVSFFSASVDSEVVEAGVSPSACWDRRAVWQECLEMRLHLPEHKPTTLTWTNWTHHQLFPLFSIWNRHVCVLGLQVPSCCGRCKQKVLCCHGVSEFICWWIYKQTTISWLLMILKRVMRKWKTKWADEVCQFVSEQLPADRMWQDERGFVVRSVVIFYDRLRWNCVTHPDQTCWWPSPTSWSCTEPIGPRREPEEHKLSQDRETRRHSWNHSWTV